MTPEISKGKILVADDEIEIENILASALSREGYEIYVAHDGQEAVDKAMAIMPDLIILDVVMPVQNGLSVKAKLNDDQIMAHIPVIFLSSKADIEYKLKGLDLMADDYIAKPFQIVELLARVKSTLSHRRHFESLAMTDRLTGLWNFHIYRRQIEALFNVAMRYHRSFSLAVIDINNLKPINDSLGHDAGNFVIRKMAEAMQSCFRKADILIRYGGDEFVILFPESSEDQVTNAMRRFEDYFKGKSFPVKDGCDVEISFSYGVASYSEAVRSPDELFALADQRMYQEKIKRKKSVV